MRKTYTKEDEQRIIDLFYELENNTTPEIVRLTGFGYQKVSTTITKHLNARQNVKDIKVNGIETLNHE